MTWPRAVAVCLAVVAALALAGCTGASPVQKPAPTPHPPVVATTPPPTPEPTPAPTLRKPAARTVTVLGSGDVLIHPPLWEQAHADAAAQGKTGYDFGRIYASIAPALTGVDLAICELETPLAAPRGPFSGWPDFNSPPQVLTALKNLGYTSCTTASNHSIDQGYSGVKRTLDELDAAGLKHTGSARSAAEAAKPLILTMRNGVKVAQLAYSFGFNGIPVPAGQPWLANRTDVPTILSAAHRAKQAGADIVVLSMHWGIEYDHLATQEQRDQAAALLASPDIDVIIGDGSHVVQPVARINRKWVVYSPGNQISRHADPVDESREGIMPKFTFTEMSPHHFTITRAEAVATWMDISPKLRLIDLPVALADRAISAERRATYQHAYDQITAYLDAYGARAHGFVVDS